ncbi:NRDE family protein [Alteromonas halophila]|uniref:NRDE family protein n=1 Tax=Alteromonas halophila TaxID=516698 RepID=A0A918JRC3_9ALTE|nr:NRDE family protein [Alteromonas halophila]GGW95604.1 hypothetical protein GCM10007391_32190 [Alteromonas halophila]
MCILFVANQQRKDMPLIIAANRDEFYRRPTLPSHFWSDAPDLLAGKDLEAGGSWMGVTRQGRIAAITNVRAANAQRDNAKSRGELVTQSLCDPSHQTLSARLRQSREKYQGYNLLFGDINALQVYNNIEDRLQEVSPGIHGLSNATLNAPWPKVTRGMQSLSEYCQHSECIVPQDLFALLRNDEQADDDRLPDTGISKEWEKRLSSIFIQSPDYGTRASTIILVNQDLQLYWHERQFSPEGAILSEVSERFQLTGE